MAAGVVFTSLPREGLLSNLRRSLRRTLNSELLQSSYNRQWTGAVGKPVVFQIELTNHCPMTCQMCPRTHSMRRPLGYMDFDIVRRVIDEIAGTTSAVFLHHFGDSLLHPELGEFVGYAARRGVRPHLSANPVLLNDKRIRALVDNGLHELVLSLDGVTGETSAAVRGRAAANVGLAERKVRALVDYRRSVGSATPYIVIQIVRQKQNAHEVEEWLARWRGEPGIDRVKVKSYVTWDGRHDEINSLCIEPRQSTADVVCDKPWTSLTVLWDGQVVPCCFDYDGAMTRLQVAAR